MKKTISEFLFFLTLLTISQHNQAQISLVNDGKANSKIILMSKNEADKTSANLLQLFVHKISGCTLPIIEGTKPTKGDILIGGQAPAEVTKDGFNLSTEGGVLRISGQDNGVVYGVVTLLEQYLGVGYWGENEYSLSKSKDISIPKINIVDNPAFRYRQSQNYALATDTIYKLWNRLNTPEEAFAANYWVHTFDKLLPSEKYGKEHPEYYSFLKVKGIREKQVNGA